MAQGVSAGVWHGVGSVGGLMRVLGFSVVWEALREAGVGDTRARKYENIW